jgi:hypothetical protein
MWSTKIRKIVFVQKVAKSKRKHPKSEDFRCLSGAAGRIRTAALILTNGIFAMLKRFEVSRKVFIFNGFPVFTFGNDGYCFDAFGIFSSQKVALFSLPQMSTKIPRTVRGQSADSHRMQLFPITVQ